jgi:putative peptidoglycan lipid II flippase
MSITNLNKDNAHVTQAAGVVGMATLLSRVLGYARDMVMAWLFGAGLVSDAFIVAFRIPNMLRRLFIEGSLSIAFVPVFTNCLNQQGREEAERLATSALRLVAVALAMVTAVGIVLSPAVVDLLAYGFKDEPEKYLLCIRLTRIMMPYILFIGLVAVCMGVLNVLGHFAAPALAPTMLNIAMIGMVSLFSWYSPSQNTRALGLALGVLVGAPMASGHETSHGTDGACCIRCGGLSDQQPGDLLAGVSFAPGQYYLLVLCGSFGPISFGTVRHRHGYGGIADPFASG